ncbi:MAG TPA: ATP-binding cassette domain-containing protein [Myxococcota bacterium]|jgi:ABC-2 type transport system ATP-binding protein|nr:ATP-binding cassette domain-containing protein [Myxococcota bacterium]
MIDVQHLTKSYGPRVAVDDVSFSIGKGEVVGFLGPNGAGKTTTMRILTGFLPATGGDVKVAGFDVFDEPMQVKRRVGYLPESPPLYPELSVGTYLEFAAELRGFYGKERLKRVGRVMEQVGLVGWEQRILGSLSKGYRQRVGLAQALVHEPDVLILDEPTSGLDPTQVMGMRELMRELAATRTVILSTHILGEVEAICPRAMLISGGKLRASGTIAELREQAPGGVWYYLEVAGALDKEVGALAGVQMVEPLGNDGDFLKLRVRAPADPREMLFRAAAAKGWRVRALEQRLPSLEEAFIGIVGREG